jgi:hypothetical protein
MRSGSQVAILSFGWMAGNSEVGTWTSSRFYVPVNNFRIARHSSFVHKVGVSYGIGRAPSALAICQPEEYQIETAPLAIFANFLPFDDTFIVVKK